MFGLLLQSTIDWVTWQQTFISHSSRGWEVQIKVPADQVPGKDFLPGLERVAFALPHMAFPLSVHDRGAGG